MQKETTFRALAHPGLWLLVASLVQCGTPMLSLTAVSPSRMDTDGGKSIVLTGQGFATGATVTIAGVEATQVLVRSSTDMVVTVPPHPGARGFVPVVIKNPDMEPVTRNDLFSYYPAKLKLNPGLLTTIGKNPTRLLAADLNRDNKTDLIVAYEGYNAVDVFLGKGDGNFTKGISLSPKQFDAFRLPRLQDAAVGDVDGDGILDMVLDNQTSCDAQVFIGKGDGTFIPPVSYSLRRNASFVDPPDPHGMVLSDINGDGRTDILVACMGSGSNEDSLAVLLGKADGFQPVQHISTGTGTLQRWPLNLALGDTNNDGKPDVAMNYLNDLATSRISIFLNTGNDAAPFGPPTHYPTPFQVPDFAFRDINGDQKLDVVATLKKGGIGMLPGRGDGRFDDFVGLVEAPGTGALGVVDFDQDGLLDLVASADPPPNTLLSPITVWLGKGNGMFASDQPLAYMATKRTGGSMVLADLNGDGLLDGVAIQNPGFMLAGSLNVFLNASK